MPRLRLALISLCFLSLASASNAAYAADKPDGSASYIDSLKHRAEHGDASAQVDLAYAYQYGRGVPKDLSAAFLWYEKAAAQDDPIGLVDLGTMLIYGTGCTQDRVKARELFQKAADKKNPYGYYELGVVFEQGLGVKPDLDKAFDYYKKAAIGGVSQAVNNLASMRAHGQLKADWTPLEMYKQAALQGDTMAEFNIGMLYLQGDGVPQDDKQAVEWLTKAAKHGNPTAQCNLGVLLATGGKDVPVQTTAAIGWLKKSAAAGDDVAKKGLARIYREGLGVPKDPKEADKWWPHKLP